MKRTEPRDALAEIDATIVSMVQMLKRLNADLLIGTKLLESRGARDRVSGAALSRAAQKEELRRRAQRQIDILASIRAHLDEAKEGKEYACVRCSLCCARQIVFDVPNWQ